MSIQHVALFSLLISFSSLSRSLLAAHSFLFRNTALFILLVKSSLTRWHWWLLFFFFFSHFSTFDDWLCVCVCVRFHCKWSVAFNHFFTCFHPLSLTTLDFHSLIHSFYIHSIEHNGGKKSLTKLNAIDGKKSSFLRAFKWLLVV